MNRKKIRREMKEWVYTAFPLTAHDGRCSVKLRKLLLQMVYALAEQEETLELCAMQNKQAARSKF